MDPKERILKLLEKGKISADEAVQLLEALGTSCDLHECSRIFESDKPLRSGFIKTFHHFFSGFRYPHRRKIEKASVMAVGSIRVPHDYFPHKTWTRRWQTTN